MNASAPGLVSAATVRAHIEILHAQAARALNGAERPGVLQLSTTADHSGLSIEAFIWFHGLIGKSAVVRCALWCRHFDHHRLPCQSFGSRCQPSRSRAAMILFCSTLPMRSVDNIKSFTRNLRHRHLALAREVRADVLLPSVGLEPRFLLRRDVLRSKSLSGHQVSPLR